MAVATSNVDTLALHGGTYRADPTTGAVRGPDLPKHVLRSPDHRAGRRLVNFEEIRFVYTRIGNPTQDVLEERLAAIEGGAAALALASGQAATALAVLTLVQAGDNIVTGTDLYGGSWNFFANRLTQFGIEARFVDPADPDAFARATDRPHPPLLRRDPAQPQAACLPDPRGRRDRPRLRHPADHRQHHRPAARPSDRSWSGDRRAFARPSISAAMAPRSAASSSTAAASPGRNSPTATGC